MAFVMGARIAGFMLLLVLMVEAGVYAGTGSQHVDANEWSMVPGVLGEMIQRGMTSRLEDYKYQPPAHDRSCTLLYEATARCSSTSMLFFNEHDVLEGKTFPMYFPPSVTAKLGFLQRRVVQEIPFTSARLADILALFHIPPGSSEAADVATTLGLCDAAAHGDVVRCVTSPDDMVGRAAAVLGTSNMQVLAPSIPTGGMSLQPYTVRAVKPVDGSDFVGCHPELYPYSVYRCHTSVQTGTYVMEMQSSYGNGGALKLVAVCHRNTTSWDPEHVSFKVLASKPGGLPICHFVPYGHVIFGKRAPDA
uniref:A2-134 protein n=1 Tax=Megathyrsus maximus TaxID=59788 RepID=Q93X11_9POAL|nr:A2-134 [Megathyrsus maximus]